MPPTSTYRLQISQGCDLWAAADLTGYLAALGVSHLYVSPLLRAHPGSAHGYDVVDHSAVDPERGGEPGRSALVAASREHGLGLVLDIVPNHMGVADPSTNPAWWDVLRLGESSRYAGWFDIDWDAGNGKLVLPMLERPADLDSARVADGELRVGEYRFPLAPGTARGPARRVLARQHYELVPAAEASTRVNYRRFFAVSTLAGLRVEDPEVFTATHERVLDWVDSGDIDGIRVDHPDGMTDPGGYLRALADRLGDRWLIVEKILEPGESLPDWPCSGTTGYDALAEITAVFIDPAGETAFTRLHEEMSGEPVTDVTAHWAELTYRCKREVATGILRAEVNRLARLAAVPGPAGGGTTDGTAIRDALTELLACFPVYRSYSPAGIAHLDHAVTEATRRRPDLADPIGALSARLRDPADPLAVRFTQTTGAVVAKGVEDTAMYRWTRFVAVNEVGGDPRTFGANPDRFHAAATRRAARLPSSMVTLSTHDTKRGEDVRARLAVLSEIPDEWAARVRHWSSLAPLPDGAFAHLLWQTVAGAWPIDRDRLAAYCLKAAREAGTSTAWDHPDGGFEARMLAVVDQVHDDPRLRDDLTGFVATITPYGWSNSLGQKLLALTMPGVPDVYQGCELWENSLVDPDNRRPVDFATRRRLLSGLDAPGAPVPPVDATGAAKLWVTSRALRARRDRPEAFTRYRPLAATGPAARHAVAYDRGGAVTVVTRLPVGLDRAGGWRGTTLDLPPGRYRNALTGTDHAGPVPLADLLGRLPVALLLTEPGTAAAHRA